MLDIIGIIFPVFAAIIVGYGFVWRGLFNQADLRVLGKFVLNIAIPALMFQAVATNRLSEALRVDWMAFYALAGILSMSAAYGLFTVMKSEPSRRAVAMMGTSCPNSGYIAYPILLLSFPAVAAKAFAMAVIVENFFIIPIALVFGELSKAKGERSFFAIMGPILLNVMKRPMIIGLLLGVLVAGSGLPLPSPMLRLMTMFSSATAALALFVIGGSLFGLPMRGNVNAALLTAIGKTLVHPLAALLVMTIAFSFGIDGMGAELRAALLIICASPMMGIYTILAQDYGHEGMASISMLCATIGSFFVFSGLLFVLL